MLKFYYSIGDHIWIKIKKNIDINKSNYSFSVVIFILILVIAGITYGASKLTAAISNGSYIAEKTCFDVDYDVTNEDGTMAITGTMLPSSSVDGGLSGRVSLKIKDNCTDITGGKGSLNLNVANSTSSNMVKTVSAHCEDSVTLKTMSNYTTSSSCLNQSNGVWVTNGSALKNAVYDTNEVSKDSVPLTIAYDTPIDVFLVGGGGAYTSSHMGYDGGGGAFGFSGGIGGSGIVIIRNKR